MNRKKRSLLWYLLFLLFLTGCGQREHIGSEGNSGIQEAEQVSEPLVGLILSSCDGDENEALIRQFEIMAENLGAQLLIRIPEVSKEEAKEARGKEYSLILCEEDPIEYQMSFVNEMVAKDAAVIAICANHPQAMEPVLAAARGVGIRVCAIEQRVGTESRDVYVTADEAAETVRILLQEQ